AATAEISRSQVWQWLKHGVKLKDGRTVTAAMVRTVINQELAQKPGTPMKKAAAEIFADMMTRADFVEFLTIPAYERID
ncbi:MAG: malate synthase A, partial [Bryobacterales bacterium]|nr:malate synthase A [Bryobacterales bacterium]